MTSEHFPSFSSSYLAHIHTFLSTIKYVPNNEHVNLSSRNMIALFQKKSSVDIQDVLSTTQQYKFQRHLLVIFPQWITFPFIISTVIYNGLLVIDTKYYVDCCSIFHPVVIFISDSMLNISLSILYIVSRLIFRFLDVGVVKGIARLSLCWPCSLVLLVRIVFPVSSFYFACYEAWNFNLICRWIREWSMSYTRKCVLSFCFRNDGNVCHMYFEIMQANIKCVVVLVRKYYFSTTMEYTAGVVLIRV